MTMQLEGQEDYCEYYKYGEKDLRATDPVVWLPNFRQVTMPTALLPVPESFLRYLRCPGLRLPIDTPTSGTLSRSSSTVSWGSDVEDAPSPPPIFRQSVNEIGSDSSDDDEPDPESFNFTNLNGEMNSLIRNLGGAVFPKINWKSPKDARWIALNKCLKCFLPGDIYLLLKSSNAIDAVINEPFKGCGIVDGAEQNYQFVIRKWMDSYSSDLEFRCFVCEKKLILICQRDSGQGFAPISKNRDKIIQDIHAFFRQHVYHKFPLDFYVFDVVRLYTGQVILMDFNIFGLPTEPLLTSYRELKMLMNETNENVERGEAVNRGLKDTEIYGEPYFRYLTDTQAPKPHPNIQAPLPTDVVTYLTESLSLES